jgi:hypothetical protein
VLLVEHASGSVLLFAAPGFRAIVEADDLPFLDRLLKDFSARSAEGPAELFRQVSALSMGPIVTQQVGVLVAEREHIESCCAGFERLTAAVRACAKENLE